MKILMVTLDSYNHFFMIQIFWVNRAADITCQAQDWKAMIPHPPQAALQVSLETRERNGCEHHSSIINYEQ